MNLEVKRWFQFYWINECDIKKLTDIQMKLFKEYNKNYNEWESAWLLFFLNPNELYNGENIIKFVSYQCRN